MIRAGIGRNLRDQPVDGLGLVLNLDAQAGGGERDGFGDERGQLA